jgi:predicted transcriptional regulator
VPRSSYRTEIEIISEILETITKNGRDGKYITNIVRDTNLSHSVALDKLKKLIKCGLLQTLPREKNTAFVITENGIRFCQELENFIDLVSVIRGKVVCENPMQNLCNS